MAIPPPDKLFLREATAAEKILCFKRNHVSWGRMLPNISDYLEREARNGSAPLTRDGGITYWILSTLETPPADGQEDANTILAACETLRKKALVRYASEGVQEATSYGIASVYANPACRGLGAARIMMERLGKWIDSTGAEFSVLYSDVGRKFYEERGGWKPYEAYQLVLPVPSHLDTPPLSTELLNKEDLRSICDIDCAKIRDNFLAREPKGSVRATQLPEFSVVEWHCGNEEFIGKTAKGNVPTVKGAKLGEAFAYWIHAFSAKKLVVLRIGWLGPVGDGCLDAVLMAAVDEAARWEFEAVVIWNPAEDVRAAAKSAVGESRYEERDNSIPCLRWRNQQDGKIEWYLNEKHAWC